MDTLIQKLRSVTPFRALWTRLRAIQQKRSIVLIALCCLTLAILGTLQLAWVGQVIDAQSERTLASLHNSMRVFIRSLAIDAAHLLTIFRAEPRWDPAERAQRLTERFFVWHEFSAFGPAIKRILYYDAIGSSSPKLEELKLTRQRFEPIATQGAFEDLEAELQSTVSRHRQVLGPDWLATWLYYPDYSALVRPVATLGRKPNAAERELLFVGYLVIQLDLEYICEHIVPGLVRAHFLDMTGDLLFDVALALDGEVKYVYSPASSTASDSGAPDSSGSPTIYSVSDPDRRPRANWVENADARRQMLLVMRPPPRPVMRFGGVQRISLRSVPPDPNLIELTRYRQARRQNSLEGSSEMAVLRFTPERPRVFVVADEQRTLEVVIKHVDGSLEAVLANQYARSAVIGLSLLLILGGAMAMIVVSLRRASRLANMRLEFAAAVSHELRTPVATIRALGDNIAAGILGTGQQAIRYGGLIRDEGRRLSEMIEQTLKLAALNSASDRYELVPVDASAVVDDALAYAQPMIEGAGFVMERSDAQGIPLVLADETALRQSLGNLLSNAVKYGLPGRWLKVELETTKDSEQREVRISVHDRGPGVPAREERSIFEPFYRSGASVESAAPGSGLGLNLAQRMVQGMGGRLSLRSEPGEGSVFTIHLPVAG